MLKLVSTPDFIHQYQVVRDDGLPDIMLSLFASELMKSLSPGSVPIYMREVLALFNWALSDSTVQRHQWKMLGPVVEVRNIIHEYLTVAAKCKLTYRADRTGVKATYVSETQETRINVRILLAALRRFYDHLISSRIYEPPNPLLHAEMGRVTQELRAQYRGAVREIEGRDPMPAVSGVDPPSGIRLSANFFRCVDREWVPKTIDDPDFPHLVYRAGKEYGWGLRELCVVRILFEGGGRISEVLDLTALDWFTSQFLNQFQARNKGSFGVRTKRFVVSSATAKLVRRYFDDDANGRRAHDPQGLCLADLGKMDAADLAKVRLFLTTRGGPVSQRMFRSDYWNPALRAAGIAAPPHIARHWFVTHALRTIERTATDQNEMVRRKAELVQYMAWKTAERTLRAYEHVVRDSDFIDTTLSSIHKAMKQREQQVKKDPGLLAQFATVQSHDVSKALDEDIAILTGAIA
jgi:integrase